VNAVTSAPATATSSSSSSHHPSLQEQLMQHQNSNNSNNNSLSNMSTTNIAIAADMEPLDFDCFTGLGEAMGDSDDIALQRWIDNMAEEDLS
jgi:hypothetical protein